MPKAQTTIRFKDSPDLAKDNYAAVKKAQADDAIKLYPGAEILSQQVITDGIPDWIKLGELRAKGQVAIRTEFTVTDEQAEKIKRLAK